MGWVNVTHRQRIGNIGELPWLAVYLSHEAKASEDLTSIEPTRQPEVLLMAQDGFADALTYHLSHRGALRLYHALGDALMAAGTSTEPSAEGAME